MLFNCLFMIVGLWFVPQQIKEPTKRDWKSLIAITVLIHMMGGWELWHFYMKYWG
jgi:hypothetical protein